MRRAYYYFVASLPFLYWEEKPPFTVDEFLEQCKRLLSKDDYQLMVGLLTRQEIKVKNGSDVLKKWVDFNADLRNEVAWFRARKYGRDPNEFLRKERGGDSYLTEIVQQASKAVDPLNAEKVFDTARWQLLDSVLFGHYFDMEVLFVYGLKLQILERYQNMETPRARAVFDSYKNISLPELKPVN